MDTLARADRDGEPAFASGFSMNYLNVQVAGCYVELGRYLEAIGIYETGLPAITPGYVRAFNLARLARSYAEVGDRERTGEIGGKALTLARGTGGARAVNELRRVREDRARWWD